MVVLLYIIVWFTPSNLIRISQNNVQWSATRILHIARSNRNAKQSALYDWLALRTDARYKRSFKRVGALDVSQVACPPVTKSGSCSLLLIID